MGLLMGCLEEDLRHVKQDLAEEIRTYHVRAQLERLALGVLASVVVTLTAGAGPLDWRAVVSVLLGALATQVRAVLPTVPMHLVRDQIEQPGAAPAATTPGGGSGQ